MDRPILEATFDFNNRGVYAISLVEDPAMESHFIALSKNQDLKAESFQLKKINEEKRLLLGLVMEPDKLIPRNIQGQEVDVVFREGTIRQLAENFLLKGYQQNSRLEHIDWIDGVSVVESWISEDPKKDKSYNFGFNKPRGSWFVAMKVHSDKIWNDYVKTGKVKGFSIDGLMGLTKLELNIKETKKDEKMKQQKSTILLALKKAKEEIMKGLGIEEAELQLGQLMSGELTIHFEGEALEVGAPVFTLGVNGDRIALPVGEYPLENGLTLVVSEEGIAGEIREPQEEPQAEPQAEPPANAPAEMSSKDVQELKETIKSILVKFSADQEAKMVAMVQEQINLQKQELNALKDENKKLKEQVMEFSKAPASEPIVPAPQYTVELNSKGKLLEKIRTAKNQMN